MSYLRHISTRRLLALLAAAVVVLAGSAAAIALATGGSGPTPPPKPLAQAVHDALAAPAGRRRDGADLLHQPPHRRGQPAGQRPAAHRGQGPPVGHRATSCASSCRPRAPTAAPATCRSSSTATS